MIFKMGSRPSMAMSTDVVEQVLGIERKDLALPDGQRKTRRIPYTETAELAYLDLEKGGSKSKPIEVKCRNLSLGGVAFFHTSDLPLRTVYVQLQPGSDLPAVKTKIMWSRCLTGDWYEYGGMFIDE